MVIDRFPGRMRCRVTTFSKATISKGARNSVLLRINQCFEWMLCRSVRPPFPFLDKLRQELGIP
jgi:hypothetical protein